MHLKRFNLRYCIPALGFALLVSSPAAAQTAPWTFNKSAGMLAGDAAWTPSPRYGASGLTLSSGSLDVPEPLVDTRQSFTVSAWVKLKQVGGYQTFVSIDGTQISGFFLQLRSSDAFAFNMIPDDKPENGTQIVLSSANLTDTNTLTDPAKVVPVRSEISGLGSQTRHTFPPYSLTVLVLKAH